MAAILTCLLVTLSSLAAASKSPPPPPLLFVRYNNYDRAYSSPLHQGGDPLRDDRLMD